MQHTQIRMTVDTQISTVPRKQHSEHSLLEISNIVNDLIGGPNRSEFFQLQRSVANLHLIE